MSRTRNFNYTYQPFDEAYNQFITEELGHTPHLPADPVMLDEVVIPVHEDDTVLKGAVRTFGYTFTSTTATHFLDVLITRRVVGSNAVNGATTSPSPGQGRLSVGIGFNMATNSVRNALLLFGMPLWQSALKDKLPAASSEYMAFGMASIIEGVLWSPIGYFKQRLYSPNAKTLRDIWRTTPFTEMCAAIKQNAFWGGLVRNGLLAFPYMAFFREGERRFIHKDDTDAMKAGKLFGIGVLSGIVPYTYAYPVEWLRMKMVNEPFRKVRDVIKENYKKGGIKVFYTAGGLSIFRLGVASGCLSVSFFAADLICKQASKLGFFCNPEKRPDSKQMAIDQGVELALSPRGKL